MLFVLRYCCQKEELQETVFPLNSKFWYVLGLVVLVVEEWRGERKTSGQGLYVTNNWSISGL